VFTEFSVALFCPFFLFYQALFLAAGIVATQQASTTGFLSIGLWRINRGRAAKVGGLVYAEWIDSLRQYNRYKLTFNLDIISTPLDFLIAIVLSFHHYLCNNIIHN
jgi:hypothetical protein